MDAIPFVHELETLKAERLYGVVRRRLASGGGNTASYRELWPGRG